MIDGIHPLWLPFLSVWASVHLATEKNPKLSQKDKNKAVNT